MSFGLYQLLCWIGRPIVRRIMRVEMLHVSRDQALTHVRRVSRVPDGAHLLVSNHISHLDPPFLAGFYPRAIDFMAMRELFARPVWAFLFRACGAFPVNRGRVDAQAVREAMRRLLKGRIVGLFPEGGIRTGRKSVLEGARCGPSAATLAQMADVPVQVVAVIGTDQLYVWQNLFRRPRLYLVYGPVLKIDKSLPPQNARTQLHEEIAKAWQEMYQAFLKQVKPSTDI